MAMEAVGHECVGFCEIDKYAVQSYRAIYDTKGEFYAEDITRIDPDDLPDFDCITGGFPCQSFSVAGKQKGKEDDRYLWPEMLRVIRELAPRWVIGENVPGILRIAGRTVCEDLEREGYVVTVFNFEAAAVGAKHRRERIFFVGNSEHNGQSSEQKLRGYETAGYNWRQKKQKAPRESARTDRPANVPSLQRCECGGERDVADAESGWQQWSKPIRGETRRFSGGGWWAVEPDMGRVANGVPSRVDRLKCLGNAVVPQQAYPIFRAIAELEAAL